MTMSKTQSLSRVLLWSMFTLSSWWVLFRLIPLVMFMININSIAQTPALVGFLNQHFVLRLMSLWMDRRLTLVNSLNSFAFEELVFYGLLVYGSGFEPSRLWRLSLRGVLAAQVIFWMSLLVGVISALQTQSTTFALSIIQALGWWMGGLLSVQLLVIFGLILHLLLVANADTLQEPL